MPLWSTDLVRWKAASFGWSPEQEEVQAPRQAALLLVPYDPLYLIVLEVSLADRDAVWRLWQAPIGESQCRPLRFCQEQSPAILCRLLSFEKQHLIRYWALVETQQLMGHQVVMRSELPIMNWLLSDPPGHKVGCGHQPSIIKWEWYTKDLAQTRPWMQSCMGSALKCTSPLLLLCYFSLSQPTPMASQEGPTNSWLSKRKCERGLQLVLYDMQAHWNKDSCSTTAPF